jgi:hypothetical protein
MTDTTPGGWPDAARPGYPQNPERDGWHWVQNNGGKPSCQRWKAGMWSISGEAGWTAAQVATLTHLRYLGPCLTPAEVAAQVEAARRDALEEAARVVEAEPEFPGRAPLVMWAVPTALTARSICRATKRNTAGAIRARGDA